MIHLLLLVSVSFYYLYYVLNESVCTVSQNLKMVDLIEDDLILESVTYFKYPSSANVSDIIFSYPLFASCIPVTSILNLGK